MKKIVLASVAVGLIAAGVGSVHGYWWARALWEDADRMRFLDTTFEDMTDVFYMEEAEDADYSWDEDQD